MERGSESERNREEGREREREREKREREAKVGELLETESFPVKLTGGFGVRMSSANIQISGKGECVRVESSKRGE